MNNSKVIIISGLPCTGKTTLGREVAIKYNLPFISKDDIKESLFDSLGWGDREWSKKLGKSTYPIIYYFIEAQLKANKSFIVESNFNPEFDTEIFLSLKSTYSFDPFIIQCHSDGDILFERFKQRSNSGERHEGHRDHLNLDEFKGSLLSGKLDVLDIGAVVKDLDTSDLCNIDTLDLYRSLDDFLTN